MNDCLMLVDIHKLPISHERAVLPPGANAFIAASAVNGVHNDSPGHGCLARLGVTHFSLGKRLVARDEDRAIHLGRVAPRKSIHSLLNDPAAILIAAICFESEKFLD